MAPDQDAVIIGWLPCLSDGFSRCSGSRACAQLVLFLYSALGQPYRVTLEPLCSHKMERRLGTLSILTGIQCPLRLRRIHCPIVTFMLSRVYQVLDLGMRVFCWQACKR
jgi:hypothetical protein